MRTKLGIIIAALGLSVGACAGDDIGSDVGEATSIPYAEGSPEATAIKAVANDRNIDVEGYDDTVGLHPKAAKNLVKFRDGVANDPSDDKKFDTLKQLWKISYCKSSCFEALLAYAKKTGVYGGNDKISVVFSPQPTEQTHLQRIADTIDAEADATIDIAMYSYSHQDPIKGALQRALDRGVKIRFLADTDLANSSSKGGALEGIGIDVRRVTKIMHHKFAIIDGPRDDDSLDNASDTFVISGSGNWSGSAGSIYDENTLFFSGYPELALRMQRDFDKIWAGSKDVVYQPFSWDQTRGDISDELIASYEDPNSHVHLTSFNFTPTSSQGWSVTGTTVVTDHLVEAILGAETSLRIASGHLVSEPIAQAIRDAMVANPDLLVEIVLDCQETGVDGLVYDLKRDIEERGGSIFYKCNTFRWHYKFAKQMHHKYIIIDEDTLYTGSLNFSANAETNTFENMLMFTGAEHASLIESYLDNHTMVRNYGRADDMAALTELKEEIETGTFVPLVWDTPISMDLDTFYELRELIREHCPATKSWENTPESKTYNKYFTSQPHWFDTCAKTGYPWPEVPENLR